MSTQTCKVDIHVTNIILRNFIMAIG